MPSMTTNMFVFRPMDFVQPLPDARRSRREAARERQNNSVTYGLSDNSLARDRRSRASARLDRRFFAPHSLFSVPCSTFAVGTVLGSSTVLVSQCETENEEQRTWISP